jgi:ABC-type branched-subunit amino acid transport system substrate-binding protein
VPQTGSVAAAVRQALAKKPGVVFIGASFGQVAANVMSAARSQGYTGTFLGGNTFNSNVTAGLAKKAGTGARSASAWYAGNDFPANTSFETAYQQRYGEPADQFAAQSFIGVQILADALGRGAAQSSKPIATRRAMVQSALSEVALTTPLGPFRFTADHDVSQIVWILAITASGHHRLVGFCNPEC